MTCREARRRLSDYIDDTLNARSRQELNEHLEACPACREEHHSLAAVRRLLGAYGSPPCPVDFTHLAMRLPAPARDSWLRRISLCVVRPLGVLAMMAAALALAVGGWRWVSLAVQPSGPEPSPRSLARAMGPREAPEVETLHRSFAVQQSMGARDGLVLFASEWVDSDR